MTWGWVDGDRNVTFSWTVCFSSSWLSFMINWFQQSFIVAYGWIYTSTVIGSDVTQQYQDVCCSHMSIRLAAEHRSRTGLISDTLTAAVRSSGEHLAWINHRIMTWFLAGHEVCCHTSPVIERQGAPVRNRKTSLPPVSSKFCCCYWHGGARLRFAQS